MGDGVEDDGARLRASQCRASKRRAREARREAVLAAVGEGITHVRADGSIVPLNEAAWRLLGITEDELTGRAIGAPDWRWIDESGRELGDMRDPVRRGLRDGTESTGALCGLQRPDRRTCWLRITVRRIAHEEGGLVVSYADVTRAQEQSRTLQRLREFEQLVARLSTRFVGLRPNEVDAAIEDALAQVGGALGVDRAYLFTFRSDANVLDQTHVWSRPGVPSLQDVRRGVDCAVMPWWMDHMERRETVVVPDVSQLPEQARREQQVFVSQDICSLACVPVLSDRGLMGFIGADVVSEPRTWDDDLVALLRQVGEAVASALDRRRFGEQLERANALLREHVDALEQTNEELQRVNRFKDEFLSVTSHELRTPLTSIRGFAETLGLHDGVFSSKQRADMIAAIERQSARLERMVADLLETSRIAAGAVETSPEPVDVGRMVTEQVHELGLTDKVAIEAGHLQAWVDRQHLRQIVTNLLENAQKYGEATIEVSGRRCGDELELAVRDRGPGVPVEFQPELFERFTQASRGTRRMATGTGLGLSIVRDLVELNGGSIHYEDADPGARFVVLLPVSPPDAT